MSRILHVLRRGKKDGEYQAIVIQGMGMRDYKDLLLVYLFKDVTLHLMVMSMIVLEMKSLPRILGVEPRGGFQWYNFNFL